MRLEDKTQEELIDQIRRLQDISALRSEKIAAQEAAFVKRLAVARKASRLANQRADKAESATRAVLKAFGATLRSNPDDPR